MSAALYSIEILRLAAATADHPRLTDPDASAERRSATCGSRIAVDLGFDAGGRVDRYGHQVNACALGQASAALFARSVTGRTATEILTARDALAAWLASEDAPPPDWPGIDQLAPARTYPARHSAIRLPFEAAVEAMRERVS